MVESGGEAPRFLPFAASQPADDVIAVASALMLLDDVGFYRKRGASFRSLLGTEIDRGGAPAGTLVDMWVAPNGDVIELELELDGRRDRIPGRGLLVRRLGGDRGLTVPCP